MLTDRRYIHTPAGTNFFFEYHVAFPLGQLGFKISSLSLYSNLKTV